MSAPLSPPAWENPVRRSLREGRPVIGITITTPSVEIAARAATLGFDFLWIEMEHSPITLETLRAMVLACRNLPAVPFARIPVNELWTAKRVLDMGVHGVIFPFTGTPELARQAAAACRYPPRGCRGSGPSLAMLTWPEPQRYHDSADEHVMVVAVIEEQRAVEQIDEIAAVEGIDVLFIGTSDLSFSLGLRGRQDDPLLQDAVARILDAARRHNKIAGCPARDADQIRRFLDQGFLFFQAATDLNFMADGARQLLAPFGKFISSLPGRTIYG